MPLDREWVRSECHICNEVPKRDRHGSFRCRCNKLWQVRVGLPGTPDEEARLKQHGFEKERDAGGDTYYVLPNSGHIIHLYTDGTWHSDKAAKGSSLENYLSWIEELSTPLGQCGF
jgi:hypothetical protein